MPEHSDLIRQAAELRQQAEHEADAVLRDRLFRMAERYEHLVSSRDWSEAHPVTVGALSDVFIRT